MQESDAPSSSQTPLPALGSLLLRPWFAAPPSSCCASDVRVRAMLNPRHLVRLAAAVLAGAMLLGLVTTSTPAQVPSVTGSFSGGTIAAGGVSIVAFTGAIADLNAAGVAVNAISVTAAVGGKSVIFVVNAPSFVNAEFNAAFPSGLSGALVVVKTQPGARPADPAAGAVSAEVVAVVDGDTLDVRIDGAT